MWSFLISILTHISHYTQELAIATNRPQKQVLFANPPATINYCPKNQVSRHLCKDLETGFFRESVGYSEVFR
jgi:hypothetical protein